MNALTARATGITLPRVSNETRCGLTILALLILTAAIETYFQMEAL
jgi:hypothetical protein